LYTKNDLIKTLEDNGYIKSDIQKSNVGGDMLQFAMLIKIAESLETIQEDPAKRLKKLMSDKK